MSEMNHESFEITPANLIRHALVEAGTLLAERDWTRGTYRCGRSLCCAGAINLALTGDPLGFKTAGPDGFTVAQSERISDLAYLTIQASKAAFLRHVGDGCRCQACMPVPAREIVRHSAQRRAPLDWYDAGIANWNDKICPDQNTAIQAFFSVPDRIIQDAAVSEFGPVSEPLKLATLTPLPPLPTPRRVLALV